ncbi:urease accessory protein UreD [Undibacterium sp. Ji83W]|uniref:urease accessory protein UreD n=1 Tax=Undibacterium sp. Ji83W TaxID=3413043 RepID=UPI003BF205BA
MDVCSPALPSSITKSHWQASLQLGFSKDGDVTRLTERKHNGPLRVQKPLYPEGDAVCHAIIIHPPGGVVGGDQLKVDVKLAADTHALVTTPGAAKWYRSNGYISAQHVNLKLDAGARLEWLPQETIFFDDACVDLQQTIHLAADARLIAADIFCFGRTASGETYNSGRIKQHCSIYREGRMIWHEQGSLQGGSPAMQSPLGLNGKSVSAMVLASGAMLSGEQLQVLREQTSALLSEREAEAMCGVTQMKSVIVARYLGNSSEVARLWMQMVWQHLRPVVIGCDAKIPRIWNT